MIQDCAIFRGDLHRAKKQAHLGMNSFILVASNTATPLQQRRVQN
jgi:hypothetical protein